VIVLHTKPQHMLPIVFVPRMNAFFSMREFIELIHTTFPIWRNDTGERSA